MVAFLNRKKIPIIENDIYGDLNFEARRSTLAIARYFPKGARITSPAGGFMLWVELPNRTNSQDVFRKALEAGISIVPGLICSNATRCRHFIRVSCGYP